MTDAHPSQAKPFPKSAQLARGVKRYRRKVASPKRWQAIIDAKQGPCRVCEVIDGATLVPASGIEFHHLVARAQGGDDVPENIVPLCSPCHYDVTRRWRPACQALCSNLDDAEYAYCVQTRGEDFFERVYGVRCAP